LGEYESIKEEVFNWKFVNTGLVQFKESSPIIVKPTALLNSFAYDPSGGFFSARDYYRCLPHVNPEVAERIDSEINTALDKLDGATVAARFSLNSLSVADSPSYNDPILDLDFNPQTSNRILPGDLVMFFAINEEGQLLCKVLSLGLTAKARQTINN
jgi:hypothetical protein